MEEWTTPSGYAGFDPVGDWVVLTRTRDSGPLERSNWRIARKRLTEAAGVDEVAEDDRTQPVYDWRAGHWACGWVEYLMVPADAPEAVLDAAQEMADALAAYPILDEEDFTREEDEEACALWAVLSPRDRADLIRQSGCDVSIFAARRDEMPHDDTGMLGEMLR